MAKDLTPKQEAFLAAYIGDGPTRGNAMRSAEAAGYKSPQVAGSRLLENVKVQAALNRHREKAAERVEISVASLTARLLGLAEKAEGAAEKVEERFPSQVGGLVNAARATLMDVAKLNGLVVEQSETVIRSPEERAARLAALKAERERVAKAAKGAGK